MPRYHAERRPIRLNLCLTRAASGAPQDASHVGDEDREVLEAARAGAALEDDLIRAAVDRAITAYAGPLVA